MKFNVKGLILRLGLFILVVMVLCCQSSSDDPMFTGKWQFTEKISSDELTFNTTRTLTLTRDSYEETYVIEREDKGSVSTLIGTKGELVPAHTSLTFILKGLGTCIRDASDKCTGDVQWFGEGTPYWSDNIRYFKTEVRGEFSATETTLHLKRDLNTDGDFGDTGEDVVFQKLNPDDQ